MTSPTPAPSASAWLTPTSLDPTETLDLVRRALHEDLGPDGDITTRSVVPPHLHGTVDFITRTPGIAAGLPVAALVLHEVCGDELRLDFHTSDGTPVDALQTLLTARAPLSALLATERVALNLLGRMSGIATLTRRWADALAGTGATVRDTRKTTPGLRALEKYAVRCGGGANHRHSLSDAAMIKDNHVLAAGGPGEAFAAVRRRYPDRTIEVEIDRLDQLEPALRAGAQLILLDNMPLDTIRTAVALTAGRAELEASGGLTLDTARQVAETGVTYLAVSAISPSAPALDIGMDLR